MKKTNQKSEENELFAKNNLLDLRLSYSRLSDYDQKGPKTLIKRSDVSGEGVEMGGLVDLLLFTPEEVAKQYYVFDGEKPTATLLKLANIIIDNYVEIPSTEIIIGIIKTNNFWGKVVNEDVLISKFDVPDFWEFLKAEFNGKDKTIVSSDQLRQAEEIVEVLKNHEYSKSIVAFPEEHEDKYAQYSFEFEYKNAIFRGIIDLLYVNHDNKTIQAIDLKTGANSASDFSGSFVKYRYYFQEALYQKALEHIKELLGVTEYETLSFSFLYVSRYERIPLLYKVSQKWHDAAVKGFTTTSGYKYKGLDEVIDDITWHWNNKKFEFSREIYEQEGSVVLNDNFITVNE